MEIFRTILSRQANVCMNTSFYFHTDGISYYLAVGFSLSYLAHAFFIALQVCMGICLFFCKAAQQSSRQRQHNLSQPVFLYQPFRLLLFTIIKSMAENILVHISLCICRIYLQNLIYLYIFIYILYTVINIYNILHIIYNLYNICNI